MGRSLDPPVVDMSRLGDTAGEISHLGEIWERTREQVRVSTSYITVIANGFQPHLHVECCKSGCVVRWCTRCGLGGQGRWCLLGNSRFVLKTSGPQTFMSCCHASHTSQEWAPSSTSCRKGLVCARYSSSGEQVDGCTKEKRLRGRNSRGDRNSQHICADRWFDSHCRAVLLQMLLH